MCALLSAENKHSAPSYLFSYNLDQTQSKWVTYTIVGLTSTQ